MFRTLPVRVIFLCICVSVTAFRLVDEAFVNTLIEKLKAYNGQYPREKVYLQTDRDVYVPGETIWLKGYLFDGILHNVDSVSRVLYVDLIDARKSEVVQQIKLKATQGQAPGQLALPDSLPTGTYLLHAYTSWMRNFPEAYYFSKTLTLIRSDNKPTANATPPNLKPDVQFLPEGGNLVLGLSGRVAFKAVSTTGKGLDVEGFVLNTAKDTVMGFSSLHRGMGNFALQPEPNQTYTAFVRLTGDPAKTYYPYPLPAVQPVGFVMTVDNLSNPNVVKVFVQHNKPAPADAAAGRITLVAQTRGVVVHAAEGPLSRKSLLIQIPRDKLPDGITQLTLFDEKNTPVSERLIFIDRRDRLRVALTPAKATVRPREAIEVDVTVTDPEGKPAQATLSLAATDLNMAPTMASHPASIVSHLLLTSDLVGTVEEPGLYTDDANSDRAMQADQLMMTQGWRRFTWTDVLAGTIPPIRYPLEEGITLTGQISRANSKPAEKANLMFMLAKKDSTREVLMGQADEKGRFVTGDLDLYDSTGVFIQALGERGNNRGYLITLDQVLKPTVRVTRVPYNPFLLGPEAIEEFLKRTNEYLEIERQIRRNKEVLLEAVTVKAKREKPDSRRMLYSTPDRTVKFDDMNRSGALTFLDVVRSRVPGVQVTGSGFDARVQIRGAVNMGGPIEPAFFLDGMPISKDAVINIPVSDIEAVDVLTGGGATIMAGSNGAGGVINVLTRRGSPDYDYSQTPTPGTLATRLMGYTPVREFYAPRYDKAAGPRSAVDGPARPDFRATLHWAPMVKTGPDGKVRVTFYASDAKTKLRLVAEGTTLSGKVGTSKAEVGVE
ncbi:TonB-dependent receptor plug domain-containing protein [Rudanella paleaurantiibacter]|uniref:TonB-dependent receptor plug domain-containing protein n=1 Tax=Rudanella paleaurantiibacter TaxID=2614655 RepID=A0A7J5TTC0_9BACT|nr:TonB-dependent receptor plug domain-containing protein [Rudanella paleaurantiibacter]KAB7727051.1 TonB-dependent receptor plug domain-containing protein [Rudanella paleaurantiibacter]